MQFRSIKNRGATLIESLFAIFLVTVCAVIMASSMPMATTARQKADLHNRAMQVAQKEIERIRGVGYANVTATQLYNAGILDSATPVATNTYAFTSTESATNNNIAAILPQGVGYVKIEQAQTDLRRVTVWVQWTAHGTTYEYRIGTLVANL